MRTVTLRAVIAPSGSLVRDNPRQAQAALERLFRDCEAEAACHAAFPDLERDFARAMARLERDPVPVRLRDPAGDDSVSFRIDQGVLAGSVRRMLMDAGLRRRLPLAIHEAATGRLETIRVGVEQTIAVAGSLAWGMGLSVVCAEDLPMLEGRTSPRSPPRASSSGQAPGVGLRETCGRWPAGTPSRPGTIDRSEMMPALLLSRRRRSSHAAGLGAEVAQALPYQRHAPGPRGHRPRALPDCALGIMASFVERGSMASVDTALFASLTPAPL
ncbi:MAG: hypothetical protein R2909_01910 [Gemmatimonadales bacterium]